MFTLSNAADLTAQTAQKPSTLQSLMPIMMILVVFYFFIIRPQSKKIKEQDSMLKNSKVGDEVLLSNGFFGTISSVRDEDDFCMIQISKDSTVKVAKSAISQNISLKSRIKEDIASKVKK